MRAPLGTWTMDEDSGGRCASSRGAASAEREWRRFIRRLLLPRQSSRKKDPRRKPSPCDERCDSEGEGDGSAYSSDHYVPFRVNQRLTCIGCNKRRPSFSDTESILDFAKMPVGTTSSALKSSFSLTSLRSSTPSDSPEHGAPHRINTERPYHSLTKKTRQSNGHGKEQDQEQWRKSWGSGISQDGKECWEGFQADYDYLMAQNMLERDMAEVEEEQKVIPRAPGTWSQSEFMEQFAALYSWLAGVQDCVHGKKDKDWKMRAERLEDMQRQRFRLEKLREESRKLIGRCPEWEAEVVGRVKEIGEKWERVEGMMKGCKKCEGEKGSKEKVVEEIRGLRNWLRELDGKLKPLSFQHGWTKTELEAKAKEHLLLHRDIEGHGKVLSSLLKHCEKIDSPRNLAVARALERKYYLYYLRSLEWQYHIESLLGHHNKGSSNASNESDGEPVPKIARFGCVQVREKRHESSESEGTDSVRSEEELSEDDDHLMDTSLEPNPAAQPPPIMADARSDGDRGRGATLGTQSASPEASPSCANPNSDSTLDRQAHSTSGGHRPRGVATTPELHANRTKEKPSNTATFDLIHLDTDPEQEEAMKEDQEKATSGETTSSEGGWTYKSKGVDQQKPKAAVRLDLRGEDLKDMKHFSAKNIPGSSTQELLSSSKLVVLAEEMFRHKTGKGWKGRRDRTRKRKDLHSYDASGENTDEEGCKWHSWPKGGSQGKKSRRHRPLSMSNVSCLQPARTHGWKSRPSKSESALNQMPEYFLAYGRANRTLPGEDGSSESARNRNSKMRKLTDKKSESGSDGLTLSGSDSSNALSPGQAEIATLVKSGSFSGFARRPKDDDATGSDTEEDTRRFLAPPVFRLGPSAGAVTVTADQDKAQVEEQHSLNWDSYEEKYPSESVSEDPVDFETAKKLLEFGEDYAKFFGNQSDSASTRNLLLAGCGRCKIDSDSDVNDVRQTLRQSLEQLEQWRKKFNRTIGGLMSGNEALVEDCVCGTFLDEVIGACKRNVECLSKLLAEVKDEVFLSQEHEDILSAQVKNLQNNGRYLKPSPPAHGAANLTQPNLLQPTPTTALRPSPPRPPGPDTPQKKAPASQNLFDSSAKWRPTSDASDPEHRRIHSSTFAHKLIIESGRVFLASDAMTSLLNSLSVHPEHLSAANMVSVQVQTDHVKDSWENLKATAEVHKAKQLQAEIALLRDELLCLAARVDAMETTVASREELEAKVTQVQNELNLMKKGKNRLLQANVSVHRFLASAKHAHLSLKDEVTDLYQVWDQTFCRVSSQLTNLQTLSQTWHDFDDHLAQLQCALRTDTLKVLDFALKRGMPSAGASFSLQDIATILSDRGSATKDSLAVAEAPPHAAPILTALSTEGSLSDSGISDSGSEQELSEREKRLAQLKKLAKRLESILAPGSQALSNMFRRIEQAESELRELQKTCRDLIVRSASSEEIRMIVATTPTLGDLDLEGGLSTAKAPEKESASAVAEDSLEGEALLGGDTTDREGGKPGKKFWLWRLLCYALPFQLALVAILCLTGMLEPRCCDSLNNLDLSLHPQLRYNSGPPPV